MSGERSEVAYWRDAEGRPCEPDEAVSVEIVEFDEDGGERRTYARLGEAWSAPSRRASTRRTRSGR